MADSKKYGRTANLFDDETASGYYNDNGVLVPDSTTSHSTTYIPVNGTTYTASGLWYRAGQMANFAVYEWDNNKNWLRRSNRQYPSSSNEITFTIGTDAAYITLQIQTEHGNVMLNTGSTALPYQPYLDWLHSLRKLGTSTDTITTLPSDLYADGQSATVGLVGNMSQTGTPSPTTPIQPQECGERTGNLLDKDNLTKYGATASYTVTGDTVTMLGSSGAGNYYYNATLLPAGNYSLTFNVTESSAYYIVMASNSDLANAKINDTSLSANQASIASNLQMGYARFIRLSSTSLSVYSDVPFIICFAPIAEQWVISNIMLNTGSTPLPYEPYGYKIPISSGGTTTPVYLGEVQSTRRIKKLVLTGEEDWYDNWRPASGTYASMLPSQAGKIYYSPVLCTHIEFVSYEQIYNGTVGISTVPGNLYLIAIRVLDTVASNNTEFKAYLATQYANGTPVTIWYVLAEPTTGIVNEPLRKIGDYADTVSGITIPTIAGANAVDVLTTLKPSEVTVNYKGWHPVADVHVYPDSSWMPTSWEEFRKAVRSGKAQSLYPVGTKLYENWGDTTSDAWIVVDYPTGEDYLDNDLAQQGYTNRVMLMEEKLNYLMQFDAIEAWLYVETAIPAGTYRFTIPNYDSSHGGNKTYIFTSTANIPVGGQLTLTWASSTKPTNVQGYSSSTSTSALFDVKIAEWDGTTACTDLGTIKLAQNDSDSTYGKLNHIHRARYGSNNYYQSGLRQWLNADATANNWWSPSNIFDRPYDNRNTAGRLNTLNSNMKAVLATPTVNCITNNLFEYPSLDGTTFSLQTAYTVTDKLFPVTHSEINLSSSPNVNSVLDYYVSAQNADRIKYRKDNGNAYYWWLRTPYPTYALNVRVVNTFGALNYYGASYTYGSAAACIIQ